MKLYFKLISLFTRKKFDFVMVILKLFLSLHPVNSKGIQLYSASFLSVMLVQEGSINKRRYLVPIKN